MPGPINTGSNPPPDGVSAAQGAAGEAASEASSVAELYRIHEVSQDSSYASISFAGWRKFEAVPPQLRSWLTDSMMEVDGILKWIMGLNTGDLTPETLQKLAEVGDRLEEITHNIQSPYFDNGAQSMLGLERLQNLMFRVGHGTVLRVNINMSLANKLDPSGRLGTAFKYAVLQWLQKEFGMRHVSQNPEGTSFLAINVGPHEISCSLGRFAREIKYLLKRKEMQKQYDFDPNLLDYFVPQATSMFMNVNAMGFEVEEILKTQDKQMILGLQNQIITRIEESLKLLSVGTMLAEKDPGSIGLQAGLAVYNAADLPMFPGKLGYERLQHEFANGTAYVPSAQYHSPMDGREFFPSPDDKLTIHPRLAHNYGRLDHPIREGDEGGALQMLMNAIQTLKLAQTEDERSVALAVLRGAAEWYSIIFGIGDAARTNARNPIFTKWIQEVNLNDGTKRLDYYFLENVSMRPEANVHLIVAEVDSLRAFSLVHPADEMDSNFWAIWVQFMWEAKKRSIDPPALSQVGGDLIAIVLPVVDKKGNPVDIADYISHVQKRIVGLYSTKPFQDYAKVEIPNGMGKRVERWPLWIVGDKLVPSLTKPAGGRPYIRTLSISAVGTTIPTPSSPLDIGPFFSTVSDLAVRVDELKDRTAPKKGQYQIVSLEQITIAVTPSVMGYFIPRETSSQSAQLLAFVSAIDEELVAGWGEPWSNLAGAVRRDFIVRLAAMMRTAQIQPILTNAVAQTIFQQMNRPVPALPHTEIILAPVLPIGVTP